MACFLTPSHWGRFCVFYPAEFALKCYLSFYELDTASLSLKIKLATKSSNMRDWLNFVLFSVWQCLVEGFFSVSYPNEICLFRKQGGWRSCLKTDYQLFWILSVYTFNLVWVQCCFHKSEDTCTCQSSLRSLW